MSSANPADANLLFGLLALQMEFISRDELLEGLNAWLLRKHDPLGRILVDRGALSEPQHLVLQALAGEHVKKHGNVASSLTSVPPSTELTHDLRALGDADVELSLAPLTTPHDPPLPAAQAPAPDRPGGGLRYRKLREHARGGLGEVSVAVDEELDREVALKEIQGAYAYDDGCRARFLREALITGKLEHPGVVPVYGLGAYADGRPYYAMRFIQGEPLHDAIARLHQDKGPRPAGERELALRGLLARFVGVCNAVAYAHSRGVIHRDLKPANVMLGEFGETLVVDWGLARPVRDTNPEVTSPARPVHLARGAGPAATEAGDVVGTPAFMPPEQALGWQDRVGPCSDIYALGGVLYCLLTGRPPHRTLAEAAVGDVTPARQVNRAVPAALEAVCARALAPQPEDRYAAVKELAQEVERWLADEPVVAHREPPRERLRRWSKRHRTLVSSAAVLLVASVVGLALGLWAVNAERERTAQANLVANNNLAKAQQAEAQATSNLKRSQENLALAKQVVDQTFAIAKDHHLLKEKGLEPVRSLLLQEAKRYYVKVQERAPGDRALALEQAQQREKLGEIEYDQRAFEPSLKAFTEAKQLYEQLASGGADAVEARVGAIRCLLRIGGLHWWLRRTDEAEKVLARGLQRAVELEKAADRHPDLPTLVPFAYSNRAQMLGDLRRHREALKDYDQACSRYAKLLNVRPDDWGLRRELTRNQMNAGSTHSRLGQDREALQLYRAAEATLTARWKSGPEAGVGHWDLLTRTLMNAGRTLVRLRQPEEALKEYTRARNAYIVLTRLRPSVPEYFRDLAIAHTLLARTLSGLSRRPEALKELDQARDIQQRLVEVFGGQDAPSTLASLAATQVMRGELLSEMNRPEDAVVALSDASEILWGQLRHRPTGYAARSGLAAAQYALGRALRRMNRPEDALRCDLLARDLRTALLRGGPATRDEQQSLAASLNNVGIGLRRLGRPEAALRSYLLARDLRARLAFSPGATPDHRRSLADTCYNMSNLLVDLGRDEEAVRTYQSSRDLYAWLLKAQPRDLALGESLARAHLGLGQAWGRLGRLLQAIASLRRGRDLRAGISRALPRSSARLFALADAERQYGWWLGRAGRTKEAAASYNRAISALTTLQRRKFQAAAVGRQLTMAYAGRARQLERGRPIAALEDWDRAIAIATGSRRLSYRAERAVTRARLTDYPRAAAEAGALARNPALTPADQFDLARAFALCAVAAGRDPALPLPRRECLADAHARRAMALLRLAGQGGAFRSATRRAALNTSEDLAALRPREDFRAFVASLPAASSQTTQAEDD